MRFLQWASMRVIVVGGSIAGCACAHALLKIGCEVIVLERATSVTAAGAVRTHLLVLCVRIALLSSSIALVASLASLLKLSEHSL